MSKNDQLQHLHFGTGKIGLGLLVNYFFAAANTITHYVDFNQSVISYLQTHDNYTIQQFNPNVQKVVLTSQSNYHCVQKPTWLPILKEAQVLSTAVGANNLAAVAHYIRSGLELTTRANKPVVLVCFENLFAASDQLAKLLKQNSNQACWHPINTVIDCIIPNLALTANQLVVSRESYAKIVYAQDDLWPFAFGEATSDYQAAWDLKFYGVNGLHLVLALLALKQNQPTLAAYLQAKDNQTVVMQLLGELVPPIAAITKRPPSFVHNYLKTNVERFANHHLKDTPKRIVQNLQTKLCAPHERFWPLVDYYLSSQAQAPLLKMVQNYGLWYLQQTTNS